MKKNKKKYWILIITLLLLILIDQKFFLGENKAKYNYDDSLLWVLKPNLDNIVNSKGFVDYEQIYESPNSTKRIVIIGDSFMGTISNHSLENTYPQLLKKILNENNLYYEVINLGVSGYGTDQELIMLQKEGLKYQPDIVILGFYLENDIPDNSRKIFEVSEGKLVKNQRIGFRANKLLYKTLSSMAGRSLSYAIFERYGGSMTHILIISGIYSHTPYYGSKIFENLELKYLDEDVEKTKILLNEFQQVCEENNISLYVLLIPSVLEVDNDLHIHNFSKLKDLNLGEVKNEITTFLKKNNFRFIDLYPVFNNQEKILYTNNDIHWNIEGQTIAAKATYDFLKDSI
ncbi:SGNH/GDSL hydrolase family protein [Candidatus Woesearchaeota archaeon]|nr:SGNH/GDSL hydrolase family protein [Candidatus Woesearchaeota archaeon]